MSWGKSASTGLVGSSSSVFQVFWPIVRPFCVPLKLCICWVKIGCESKMHWGVRIGPICKVVMVLSDFFVVYLVLIFWLFLLYMI